MPNDPPRVAGALPRDQPLSVLATLVVPVPGARAPIDSVPVLGCGVLPNALRWMPWMLRVLPPVPMRRTQVAEQSVRQHPPIVSLRSSACAGRVTPY